jgi:hypothetical protein
LAVKTGKLQIDNDAIREAKQVRDAAAHALENIVADYEGVKRLGRVKRECLRILGGA